MNERSERCQIGWIKRKSWPVISGLPAGTIRIVDLFCGCGGLTLGAWEAARTANHMLDIRFAVDSSPYAVAVFRNNFKLDDSVVPCANITKVLPGGIGKPLRDNERKLRKQAGKIDVLVAGPPCQGHSDLNNHTRRTDPRNRLYLRVVRGIEVFRPKVVMIENVGAVIHDTGGVIDASIGVLKRLGYAVATRLVRTEELGLPQRRRRHILLALRHKRADVESLFPKPSTARVALSKLLSGLEDEPEQFTTLFCTPSRMTETNRKRVKFLFKHDLYDLPNRNRPPCHSNGHSYKSMYGRLRWDEPAQTITTGFGSMGQGRFVHPTRQRMITPHEAARIQGFPDFYDFSMVQGRVAIQDLIGNAVPPMLASEILTRIFTTPVGRRLGQ